jgi:putative Mg2+ transporter-C (MgtC) family protein
MIRPSERAAMPTAFPWSPVPPPLLAAALNLFVAMACGAVIGSERQIRQRMAGLRTNALVALGAAAFVTFAALYPDEVSPTRVAAQIVSGIGFLGAGIIFRDGFNVHGLNTAATLWCSAGVGMMAGAGAWPQALLLTGFVVFVNLGLRPFVKWLKRHTAAGRPVLRHFRVTVACDPAREGEARAFLLRNFAVAGLHLTEIGAAPRDGLVEIVATVSGEGSAEAAIELALARLAAEPGLARVGWQAAEDA